MMESRSLPKSTVGDKGGIGLRWPARGKGGGMVPRAVVKLKIYQNGKREKALAQLLSFPPLPRRHGVRVSPQPPDLLVRL